ncbi:MAG: hypothetical protein AB8B56_00190 [Crocinitomicaceae bacterium]
MLLNNDHIKHISACTEASDKLDSDRSEDPVEVQNEEIPAEEATRAKRDSIRTEIQPEATHHVFGVKYTNRKMYERYKAAYMAFKKSLQQFAD